MLSIFRTTFQRCFIDNKSALRPDTGVLLGVMHWYLPLDCLNMSPDDLEQLKRSLISDCRALQSVAESDALEDLGTIDVTGKSRCLNSVRVDPPLTAETISAL